MPSSSFATILNRITFITRLIMKDENLTVNDIDSKWRDCLLCDGSSIHIKTLCRDREKIRELFGIDIKPRKTDKQQYTYYIKNKDDVDKDSFLQWHISLLSMTEVIAGYKKLRSRILLENYAPDPHLLPTILEAMKNKTQLEISYHKFNGDITHHAIEPYFLKDYQHRLYIVGKISEHEDRMCVFSLDRIEEIEPLDIKFKIPATFTANEFFEDCFGVMKADNVKTTTIIIRAYGDEMYYINSKPIHHSQTTIGNLDLDQGYCDFELYMKPTNDFIGYILSRSNRIEVLRPKWLRKQILATIQNMSNRYTELDH